MCPNRGYRASASADVGITIGVLAAIVVSAVVFLFVRNAKQPSVAVPDYEMLDNPEFVHPAQP